MYCVLCSAVEYLVLASWRIQVAMVNCSPRWWSRTDSGTVTPFTPSNWYTGPASLGYSLQWFTVRMLECYSVAVLCPFHVTVFESYLPSSSLRSPSQGVCSDLGVSNRCCAVISERYGESSMQCEVFSVHFVVCSMQCAACSVQCSVYSVKCVVFSV